MKVTGALLCSCLCVALVRSAPLQGTEEDVGEYGDLYQGDILLPPKRNGHPRSSRRWPNGVIPYVIDSSISSSGKSKINQAVQFYKTNTCIRWVPRSRESTYVTFTGRSDGCFSMIGMQSGSQKLNMASNCFNSFGTVLHEMMHAVGFYHEQAREDRDSYVTIHWNNIRSDRRDQFEIQKGTKTYGTRYDLKSVMHYGAKAFSSNGQNTITAKSGSSRDLGQRSTLTSVDIFKIQAMYKCSGGGVQVETTTKPTSTGSVKTTDGRSCVFPFTYNGNKYYQCTDVDEDDFWCATTSSYDRDQEFGWCAKTGTSTDKTVSTRGGNANGAKCVFPFVYNGVTYRACTSIDEDAPWCATTSSYDRDQKYGFCV